MLWFLSMMCLFSVAKAALFKKAVIEWMVEDGLDASDDSPYYACPAKSLACSLMNSYSRGTLSLAKVHPSGVVDNAFAYNNMNDMCNGLPASRSSYKCKECPTGAPGGTVCLSSKLLSYLTALVSKGSVYVTELAGACHSCNSKHYLGLAVDLRMSSRSQEYVDTCNSMGGRGINEGNHIHCQFNG